ncbi:hypothetical protein FKM82_025312 [Ascaphus truei]
MGRFSTPECVIQRSPPLINMGLTLQRFHYPTLLPERIPLDNRGLPVVSTKGVQAFWGWGGRFRVETEDRCLEKPYGSLSI